MTLAPSPSPIRPRRPGLVIAIASAVVVAAIGALAATAPLWAGPWVEREAIAALSARTGADVTIGWTAFSWDAIELGDVEIRAPDALIRFDRVEVDWALAGALPRPRVRRAAVGSGEIEGTFAGLLALARRERPAAVEPSSTAEPSTAAGAAIELGGLTLALREPGAGLLRSLAGTLAIDLPAAGPVTLALAGLEAELPAGIRARVVAVRGEIPRGPEAGAPSFSIEGGHVTLTPEVALAGITGAGELRGEGWATLAVRARGGFADPDQTGAAPASLWSVDGEIDRDLARGRARLEIAGFELGRIPDVIARLPLVESEHGKVGGALGLELDEGRVRAAGELELSGLNVAHPVLASVPVRDLGLQVRLRADVDPAEHRVWLRELRLRRGGVAVDVTGELVHGPDPATRRYDLTARMPETECQEVLAALPIELVPSLQGFQLTGRIDLEAHARVDLAALDAVVLDARLDPWRCRVQKAPPQTAAARLAGPFTHRVTMRDGSERVVRLFPGSGSFTPLSQISPHLQAAVLTTEDAGFWTHRGFLPSQFQEALRRNLRAGTVRLGASTITMQMVKNVLLSHERTLSRKLQELVLTWYVEQVLTKERILEIYLNVVEFGPGMYGVTRASQHDFGKAPIELNPVEAVYLALMLPSPVRRHVHYCRGTTSPGFEVKIRRILGIMHARGRIGDDEYELWKDEPLVFDPSARESEAKCLGEIERLLRGEVGQRALSGLLGDDLPEDEALGEIEPEAGEPGLPSLADLDRPPELRGEGEPP